MTEELKELMATQVKLNESAGASAGGSVNMDKVEDSIRSTKQIVMDEITKLTEMIKELDEKDRLEREGGEENKEAAAEEEGELFG